VKNFTDSFYNAIRKLIIQKRKKHSAVDDGRATGANDNNFNKLKHSCIPLKKVATISAKYNSIIK